MGSRGFWLWNVAAGRAQVSLLLYLEPVVSVAGAAVFLGERVSPVMIGGGALILSGVAISGTGRDPEPTASKASKARHHSRNDRKAARTSSTNNAGCSRAAKWPPWSGSFQYRRSVKSGSAQRRDGR